jgi:hypothetical protein
VDLDEQRILRFIATYHADHGYLPTLVEIAAGCAYRSRGAVRRIVLAFEDAGIIERDPAYPRLGIVHVPPELVGQAELVMLTPEQELWLCEFSVIESRGSLDALRKAMDFAPDLDAMDYLLRASQDRLSRLRAYEHARERLEGAGVELDPAARRLIGGARDDLRRRHGLFHDFPSYCLYSLAMNASAQRMLRSLTARIDFTYLAPIYLSERRAFGSKRLDVEVARAPWGSQAVLEATAFPIASWLTQLRRRICDRLPPGVQADVAPDEVALVVAEITA